jgi:hypothetical protein
MTASKEPSALTLPPSSIALFFQSTSTS